MLVRAAVHMSAEQWIFERATQSKRPPQVDRHGGTPTRGPRLSRATLSPGSSPAMLFTSTARQASSKVNAGKLSFKQVCAALPHHVHGHSSRACSWPGACGVCREFRLGAHRAQGGRAARRQPLRWRPPRSVRGRCRPAGVGVDHGLRTRHVQVPHGDVNRTRAGRRSDSTMSALSAAAKRRRHRRRSGTGGFRKQGRCGGCSAWRLSEARGIRGHCGQVLSPGRSLRSSLTSLLSVAVVADRYFSRTDDSERSSLVGKIHMASKRHSPVNLSCMRDPVATRRMIGFLIKQSAAEYQL